jgi:hypothetical protein
MAYTPLRAESACANPVARRELFAGAIGVGALALPAIVSPAPGPDNAFWKLHNRWKAIDRQWQAALDEADEDEAKEATFDHWSESEYQARIAALLAPISMPQSLLAKLAMVDAAVDLDTGDDAYPDFWACLVRDVKGMAS